MGIVLVLAASSALAAAQSRVDLEQDPGDRLILQKLPNGGQTSYEYDAAGNLRRMVRLGVGGKQPWLRHGLNGRAYRRLEACGSWADCEATAQGLGAHLATLRNDSEHIWLYATHSVWNLTQPLWMGLMPSSQSADGWAWVSGDSASFRAWAPGEPACTSAGGHVAGDRGWHAGCAVASADAVIERASPPTERLPIQLPAWLASKTEHAGIYMPADGCWFGLMLNSPTNENAPNAAEWTFQIPAAGTYELQVEYTADEPRPMDVFVNGTLLKAAALAVDSGSWCSPNVAWESIGTLPLSAGPAVVRLQRDTYMPHVSNLRWVPR